MYNEIVDYIIDVLSKDDYSYQELITILGKIFNDICPKMGVGKINVDINARINPFTDIRENVSNTYYQSSNYNSDNFIDFSSKMKKGGALTVRLYPIDKFSEEQAISLKRISYIISTTIGKYRMEELLDNTPKLDQLTGILNTQGLHQILGMLIGKKQIENYNIIFFNIKDCKGLNRQCGGIQKGNILLKKYIKQLNDLLGNDEYIARHGGDNFSMVFKKEHTPKILDSIKNMNVEVEIDGNKLNADVQTIAGLYEPKNDDTVTSIMNGSSIAMYIGKKIKDVSFLKFDDKMRERTELTRRVKETFPYALEDGRIQAYFQPKVDLRTNQLSGSEALCRWFTNEGNPISPGIFIPALEEENLIRQLDFKILENVCESIKRQLEHGIQPVKVSVNFSRHHFVNPKIGEEFINRLIRTIKSYEIDPKYIEVEFTESGVIENYELLQGYVKRLHDLGVTVAIDDYGTGYSSLQLLEQVNFDTIKIDKTFADGIGTKEGDIIFTSTSQMMRKLGKSIVCEGVETKKQIEFLKHIKCNIIQGYYYDKALPLNEYEERLKDKIYER